MSDVTPIRTDEGFVYAALITDACSRKIVGANIGDSLEAEECLVALQQALAQLPAGKQPLHHSDRGSQYCCHAYVDLLLEHGLEVSMMELRHCYENAKAERVNGSLKQEYGLDQTFRTKDQAAGHSAACVRGCGRGVPDCRPDWVLRENPTAGRGGAGRSRWRPA